MEAVTAVLIDRERAARGLGRMVAWSVALHVAFAALVAVSAGRLLAGQVTQVPRVVMEVSLGGARGGPDTGGANPLGGRPVQLAVPKAPEARPQPLRTPAAKTPEVTIPVPALKPRATPAKAAPPAPEVKIAPEGARGRVPVTGPEEKFGESFAETGVSGLGMGLATGGAGTGASLDVNNFCCPDYLRVMARKITESWNSRQGVAGITVLRFTVQRDGRITDIATEQSAGYMLDLIAQRALQQAGRLPPLPPAYTFPGLTIFLKFEYQR
jgi:TonB family protein